jgi:hypothetical protein
VIEMTNSAWTLLLASSLSSRPSCERHVRHVVSLSSADTSVTVAFRCGLVPPAPAIIDALATEFQLTSEEREQLVGNQRIMLIANRAHWAMT